MQRNTEKSSEKVEERCRKAKRSDCQFSHSVLSDPFWLHGLQHPRLPCPSKLAESTQTHVHWFRDAIQPSHTLPSPSPPLFNLSQNLGLFQWVSSSYQWPNYWRFSFSISHSHEYSWLTSFRIGWLDTLAVQATLKSLLQNQNFSRAYSCALSFLYSPALTSIDDYWKNHSFD